MLKTGIDLVYIPRIKRILQKEHILNKIFTKAEIENQTIETIAGIYAAKEATIKALHLGINSINLTDIEILHEPNGAPYITFHNELKKLNESQFSLSISHEHEYATAIVISL